MLIIKIIVLLWVITGTLLGVGFCYSDKSDGYFEQDQQSRFTELNDRSEVEFYIVEIPEDTRIDEKLGGYIE